MKSFKDSVSEYRKQVEKGEIVAAYRGLKIAIVLIHDKLRFEAWLAGSNKIIQAKCREIVKDKKWDKYRVPEALKGPDSIIECDLVVNPDFSDMENITQKIEERTVIFVKDVEDFLDGI
jgi:hypothetical protein